jgi:ABC-2 type transport system ATP-binding protein
MTEVSRRSARRVVRLVVGTALYLSALSASAVALAATTSGVAGAARPHSARLASSSCHRPKPAPVVAQKVTGSATDWTITSFDGAKIRAHWFPIGTATAPAPTILMGPGWGESGETDPSAIDLFGGMSIDDLHAAGFNVLTWDPRGFGLSTGTIEVDSSAYEARDVSRLIDWVATQPGVELDGPNDPRVGMVGASYGGGIQFVSAAIDCRIDAIVPTIAWHTLTTSLYPTGLAKSGWGNLLYASAASRQLDEHIRSAEHQSLATGTISAANVTWFAERSSDVSQVKVPTLIVQGTVDNLFPLEEGVANYENLRARGIPTDMIWFCGGHGVCLTNPGSQAVISRATVEWLDRYVKGETDVATGPGFEFVDQNGSEYSASAYPLAQAAPLTGVGAGTLRLVAGGGSGPAQIPAHSSDPLAGVAGSITPGKATNAVDVTVAAGSRDAMVVGPPKVTLTYHGTVAAGARPERIFAQLVDDKTGLVLGNQITPIPVALDGRTHTETVPLELVSFAAHPGQRVTLQLVATTVAYATPRLGGTVTFSHVTVQLPVAAHLTPH